MRVWPAALFAACVAGGLAACSSEDDPEELGPTTPTPKAALAHSNFGSCEELRSYRSRAIANDILRDCWGCAPPLQYGDVIIAYQTSLSTMPAPEPAADAPARMVADPDTGYVYLLRGKRGRPGGDLITVNAAPTEEMAITSRIVPTAENETVEGVYLEPSADRLVVIRNRFGGYDPSTELLFYDLTNPGAPALVDRYWFDGGFLTARRVGQRLHVVTQKDDYPASLRNDDSFNELRGEYYTASVNGNALARRLLRARIVARIESAVRDAPLAELLPGRRRGMADPALETLACTQVSRPGLDAHAGTITIWSVDIDGGALAQTVWTGAAIVHASARHVYLGQPSSTWRWDEAQGQQTAVYRFRLGESGSAEPAGHAVVDGWLSNGYGQSLGLSEHGGHLRFIATERQRESGWQPTSHLFVLGPTGTEPFDIAGQLRDFAASGVGVTRFFGNLGLVDGSGAVPAGDPLLTFDLSDPTQPAIAGSLALGDNGVYMQPFGDGRLLAQGRPLALEARHQIELQVLDVTSPAAVQPAASIRYGEPDQQAWGVTYYEPEAFALSGDVFAMPLQIDAGGQALFGGFVVYRVTSPDQLTELGRTDHRPMDGSDPCGFTYNGRADACLPLDALRLDEAGGRTVLYTLSEGFLKADAVGADTLTPIQSLPLAATE